MHDGGEIVLRHMAWQPVDEPFEIAIVLALGQLVLLRPACDLPPVVIAGLAEICEAQSGPVDAVQLGERFGCGRVDSAAGFRRRIRQGVVVEDAALQPVHHVERCAHHLPAGLEKQGGRHWDIGRCKRADDPELAIDGMGGGQHRAGRLLAQHQPALREGHEEGGVGLSAADALQMHRPLQAGDGAKQVVPQPPRIEIGRLIAVTREGPGGRSGPDSSCPPISASPRRSR